MIIILQQTQYDYETETPKKPKQKLPLHHKITSNFHQTRKMFLDKSKM